MRNYSIKHLRQLLKLYLKGFKEYDDIGREEGESEVEYFLDWIADKEKEKGIKCYHGVRTDGTEYCNKC